jgi:hypothetical protein
MKRRRWTDGGEYAPTVAATALSLLSAPIGGLGIIVLIFGGWLPGVIFTASGLVMWFTGRHLIDR